MTEIIRGSHIRNRLFTPQMGESTVSQEKEKVTQREGNHKTETISGGRLATTYSAAKKSCKSSFKNVVRY